MQRAAEVNMNIIINQDNDYFFKLDPALMTEQGLRAQVAQYADFGISAVVFCTNGQRTSYRSRVLDAIWDPVADGSLPDALWACNAKKLFDSGIDPYHIWLDECRRNNISPWISLRMNDMHHTHPSLRYRGDRKWLEHPEWTRTPERFRLPPGQDWQYYQDLQVDLAWNYCHPGVQDLMLKLLAENVERYDADVYELDFSRTFYCMPEIFSVDDMKLLTGFIRACRQKIREYDQIRRKNSKLAVRMPWIPELALAWGYDIRTWAAEDLIDIVVASPYWRSFQYDFSQKHWADFVGENVDVIPAVDFWIAPGPELPLEKMTAEFLCGWCRNMESQGADSAYLFNFPYWIQTPDNTESEAEKIRGLARRGLGEITRHDAPVRYQIGYVDLEYPGQKITGILPIELRGAPAEINVLIKNPPRKGRVTVSPLLEDQEGDIVVKLNGVLPDRDESFDVAALHDGVNTVCVRGRNNRLLNLYLQCE